MDFSDKARNGFSVLGVVYSFNRISRVGNISLKTSSKDDRFLEYAYLDFTAPIIQDRSEPSYTSPKHNQYERTSSATVYNKMSSGFLELTSSTTSRSAFVISRSY